MLYVVGIGANGVDTMTNQAIECLNSCDLIVGYNVYIDLIKESFSDKQFFSTAMKGEVERCKFAIDKATKGENVAVVSSGDSGVYGMASLIYELCENIDLDIKILPGVSAALSGASVLGAPIGHDFCIISLSDLLTPYSLIEKRIRLAAQGDFVIVLYNPASKKRADYLKKMCDIILNSRDKNVVCGYVQNIGRSGERAVVTDILTLRDEKVDMFTTIFIGNTATRCIKGKMVTPRGYSYGQDNDIWRDY